MKRRFFLRVSMLGFATGTLILTSCSTPQTRISEHQDLYQSLSHRDQALVVAGQIRIGMSRTAVWLAWGSPDRKIVGNMGGGPTETWIYVYYATYRTIRPTDRGAPGLTSGIPSTIHSIIHSFRRAFLIPARWSLSLRAELRLFSTWYRSRSRSKILSHCAKQRTSIPAGVIHGLPFISRVPPCAGPSGRSETRHSSGRYRSAHCGMGRP